VSAKSQKSLESLLSEYGRGSTEAFREFFARTKVVVYGYLRKRLADGSSADDVFQETYLRVHRYITSFDADGNALAWLLRIAHGCLSDHLRKRYEKAEVLQEMAPEQAVEARAEDVLILRETLVQAASLVGRGDVELILERFVDGDSFEEIADRRSWTPANARQRLSRALRKLKAGPQT
jgi:RNA polymerase sigma-70 factor (ECF subfamily)